MKFRRLLFIGLLVVLFANCDLPSRVTVVNNPTESEGNNLKGFTTSLIATSPVWKGNGEKSKDKDSIYMVSFNVEDLTASINSSESETPVVIPIKIEDDGSITSMGNKADELTIKGNITQTNQGRSFDLKILDQSNNLEALLYSSSVAETEYHEDFDNPQLKCQRVETQCYDVDGDIVNDEDIYIAGYVQTNDEIGNSCNITVSDYCLNETTLIEIYCNPDTSTTEKYLAKNVHCICADGRCLNKTRIRPLEIPQSPNRIYNSKLRAFYSQ